MKATQTEGQDHLDPTCMDEFLAQFSLDSSREEPKRPKQQVKPENDMQDFWFRITGRLAFL